MISYAPLWKTMEKQGISTYALINKYNINPRTIHNLKHNKSITLFTLERLCQILNCQAESVVEFIDEK
jgi:DNA-binding Xre family transcriptional regulator